MTVTSPGPHSEPDPREPLGRIVRETWVAWAKEQENPKPSWLAGWDELDDGQREVDMRIASAVAAQAVHDAGFVHGVMLGKLLAARAERDKAVAQVARLAARLAAMLAAADRAPAETAGQLELPEEA